MMGRLAMPRRHTARGVDRSSPPFSGDIIAGIVVVWFAMTAAGIVHGFRETCHLGMSEFVMIASRPSATTMQLVPKKTWS